MTQRELNEAQDKSRMCEHVDGQRQSQEEVLRKLLQESEQREQEFAALLAGSRAVLEHREFATAARAIFDTCKHFTRATAGYVALLSKDGTDNEVLFLDSGDAVCEVDPTLPMPVRGLREQAYKTGQTVFENDFANHQWAEFLPPGHAPIYNVLFAPLLIRGIAVGLLGLANKPGGFTEDDARMASVFGELAAVALLNSRAVESLQNSEERFRAVAQAASEAIIAIDSQGVVIFWNKAAAAIFGYTPEEIVGMPLGQIMPERFRAAHRGGLERLVSTQKPRLLGKTTEMVGLRKDGSEFPVALSLSTWKIKENVFFSGIVRDITNQVQAQEEIESLARFPSENRNPVLRASRDGMIRYANAASAPLLAAWGTQVGDRLPETLHQLTADAIASGESRTAEVPCDERIFSLDLAPVPGEDYVNLYGHDVTERVRTEEEIESLARFPSENRNPVLRASRDGMIRYANAASAPLLATWGTQVGDRLPETLHQLTADAVASGESRTAEVPCDGRIFSLDLAPVPGEDYVNLYGRDITEQARAEQALKAQNRFITTVFESLNHPFYVIDATDFTVKMANPAAYRGELPEKVSCYALTHGSSAPCSGENHVCPVERIKETKQPVILEHIHIDRDGNRRIYENHAHPIIDSEGSVTQIIEYTLDVTERKRAEEALEARTFELGERVKELNCLYGISALLERPGITVPEILQGTVDLIPRSWQHPEATCARITLDGQVFKTRDYVEAAPWKQTADVVVYGKPIGRVEVCYHGERLASDKSPFLKEEWDLLDAIAKELGRIIERVRAEEALQRAHDELELRVQERTAELALANQELREVAERNAELYQAEQRARHTADTLSAASLALTQTLDLDTVINTLLDFLGRLVPYDRANLMMPRDESTLTVRAVRGYERRTDPQELLGLAVEAQTNPHIQTLLTTHECVLIPDTRDHPDWKGDAAAEHAFSWLGLPVVAEDRVIGVCVLEKNEPGFYRPTHMQLAQALVAQSAVSVQNAWLFQQVRAGRERLQSLSQRLVEVQESERRYIARELHDEASQALISLKVGLRLLEREAQQPEAIVAAVSELRGVADGVLGNLHRLAINLRPASLDHLGLVAAIRQYAEAISNQHGLVVQFEAVGAIDRLPSEIETALYRIVQEALTNVLRHAKATRADVLLERRDDTLIVLIEDNGVGFDPLAVDESGHLGLFGMRERTEMLDGTLTIESTRDVGTTVLLEVPYVNPDIDCR